MKNISIGNVVFAVELRPGRERMDDYLKTIIDYRTGVDMYTLKEVVDKQIPATDNQNVIVTKMIIDIDYEFTKGHYCLKAMVKVKCDGHYEPEIWEKISGIYMVIIDAYSDKVEIRVER